MNKNNKNAFSLIELLVAIFIFSIGVISVFSMIISTLNMNEYNKNYIIAASLAREQVELFRNIRDSNYKKIQIYNQINPASDNHDNVFQTGSFYRIQNDFSQNASFPVKTDLIKNFSIGDNEFTSAMEEYRLCKDDEGLYVYCKCDNGSGVFNIDCNSSYEQTPFYKFIKVNEVSYFESGKKIIVPDAIEIVSKVVWYGKGFKEFEMASIFTDYKRF